MYNLFEFAVEWIPAIRSKSELSSVQKITWIPAMADKKIISVFCITIDFSMFFQKYYLDLPVTK